MWISLLTIIKYNLRHYCETTQYTDFYNLTSFFFQYQLSSPSSWSLCSHNKCNDAFDCCAFLGTIHSSLITVVSYFFLNPLQARVLPQSSRYVLSRFLSLLLTTLLSSMIYFCVYYVGLSGILGQGIWLNNILVSCRTVCYTKYLKCLMCGKMVEWINLANSNA